MNKLTREQAAVIGLYTGVLCGPFEDVHELFETVLGHPVFTHELANKELWDKVKKEVKPKFLSLCVE